MGQLVEHPSWHPLHPAGRREVPGELLLFPDFSCVTELATACSECFHELISLYGHMWENKSSVG